MSFLSSLLPTIAGVAATAMGLPVWAGPLAGGITGLLANKGDITSGILGALGGWGGGTLVDKFAQAGLTADKAASLAEIVSPEAAGMGVAQMTPMDTLNTALTAQNQAAQLTGASVPGSPFAPTPLNNQSLFDAAWQSPTGYTPPPGPDSLFGKPMFSDLAGQQMETPFQKPLTNQSLIDVAGRAPTGGAGGIDQIWAGMKNAGNMLMDSPKQALKEYGLPTAAAFAPLLAYGLGSGSSNSSLAPTTQTGTLRPYDFNQGKPLYDPKGRFLGYSNSTYTALPTTPIYAAQGGIMGLAGGGQPLPPRMIKGGGTGLSDSVPARLTNGQPAALADGEFVVSADVVSALGEGSTDAGARKLYSMMDRVRKQAHGHKKQVRRVNDRKVLPA